MKCTICKKEIVLVPSAAARAKKFGGTASDYTKLFTTHAACVVAEREANAVILMRKIAAESAAKKVTHPLPL